MILGREEDKESVLVLVLVLVGISVIGLHLSLLFCSQISLSARGSDIVYKLAHHF